MNIKGESNLVKQNLFSRFVLFIWFALLIGCSASYNFATDGPFVTATVSPGGPDDYRNLISERITIYDDGTLILSHDKETETEAPIFKTQLTKDEIEQLKALIIKERFFQLDDDITTPSEDGTYHSITVFLTDRTREVSGWNPDNEHFHKIRKHIFNLIDKGDRTKWATEMSEYVWETDALSRYEIDQYNEDGPFFTLKLETPISSEYYHDKYYQEITLDLDGHLKVIAKDVDDDEREIKEIQPLELIVSNESMTHIQQLITENFWKLNETESSDDGNLMEYMTVYLAEDSKTVVGYEPDYQRYTWIKKAIFELIDSDLYEEWEQQVIEHFDKVNEDEITQYLEGFNDEFLYDIAYILEAPKARKKNDLSKVIKIVFTEMDQSKEHTIGLDIDRKVIHIEPWITQIGILSTKEKEEVEDLEEVNNILEKHNVQEWKMDYTLEESFSFEDEYSWGLWIQFEDGTVEEHRGSGSSKQEVIPENFTDFAEEIKEFVKTNVDDS